MNNEKEVKDVESTANAQESVENTQTEAKEVKNTSEEEVAPEKKDDSEKATEEVNAENTEEKTEPEEADLGETVANKEETTPENKDDSEKAQAEVVAKTVEEKREQEEATHSDKKVVEKGEAAEEKSNTTALESEDDLQEKEDDSSDESHDEEHDEEVDYTVLSKEELVDLIKDLAKDDKILKADKIAREIKPLFQEIHNAERTEALEKFVADGGTADDFEFKNDDLANRFDANLKLIRDRKNEFVREREGKKDNNLKKKQDILERLRQFVDSDETNISFDNFKKIQDEWKSVGPIPGAQARTLWANYNALIDRFYDNRSIYFELKELDRKKNLEGKIELCERAEKLLELENLKDAIQELNELHHDYKFIGPVPKQDQEPTWLRFKAASDAIYEKRRAYVDVLKGELDENLVVKKKLIDELEPFVTFDADRIREWNDKTKDLLAIQKRWEATGGVPRSAAKDINKRFWGAFKTFFSNKNGFFKKLDANKEENLAKKQAIVDKAKELKDSTDWQKTASVFKQLQQDWKDIGHVPEKRKNIYKEFKKAADEFFERKRSKNKDLEKDFEKNFEAKIELCELIEKMVADKSNDLDAFRDIRDAYSEIGFVPRTKISVIKSKYSEAVDKFINSLEGITNEERQKIRLENQLSKIVQGPNAEEKLFRKEQTIRKQIGNVENDIALWKNNLEFFASSKTADKLRDEFNEKIDNARGEIKNLKQQLKIIRSA